MAQDVFIRTCGQPFLNPRGESSPSGLIREQDQAREGKRECKHASNGGLSHIRVCRARVRESDKSKKVRRSKAKA